MVPALCSQQSLERAPGRASLAWHGVLIPAPPTKTQVPHGTVPCPQPCPHPMNWGQFLLLSQVQKPRHARQVARPPPHS